MDIKHIEHASGDPERIKILNERLVEISPIAQGVFGKYGLTQEMSDYTLYRAYALRNALRELKIVNNGIVVACENDDSILEYVVAQSSGDNLSSIIYVNGRGVYADPASEIATGSIGILNNYDSKPIETVIAPVASEIVQAVRGSES